MMDPDLLASFVALVERGLHCPEGLLIDQRLMTASVLDALKGHDADVVLPVGLRPEASLVQQASQLPDRDLAPYVSSEGPGDVLGSLNVDDDCGGIPLAEVAAVQVADRRSPGRAPIWAFLSISLAGLGGQVVRVVLAPTHRVGRVVGLASNPRLVDETFRGSVAKQVEIDDLFGVTATPPGAASGRRQVRQVDRDRGREGAAGRCVHRPDP
jgi:hypothetical protein